MVEQTKTGLFRRQVVEHQSNELLGKMLITPQIPVYLAVAILLLWLFAGCFWLANGTYSRQINATGWVEPESGVIQHYSTRRTGTVASVHVSAGDFVTKNQILVKINTESYTADGKPVNQLLTDQLYWLKADLDQQIKRAEQEFELKHANKSSQLSRSKLDHDHLKAIYESLVQQTKLASETLDRVTALYEKGWTNALELNQAKQKALQLKTQQLQTAREQLQLEKQIRSLEYELKQLPTQHQNNIASLERQKREHQQKLIQLSANREEIIVARKAGRVAEIFAKPGQSFDMSKPLLSVSNTDEKMVANILLPVKAAGLVQSGQPLKIRYDAFPYEKFGLFDGTVQSISDSVLLPNEYQRLAVPINEPFYLVRARLAQDTVFAYGNSVHLKSGMTLSTQISTGHRTLFEWLFEPLLSLKGRV